MTQQQFVRTLAFSTQPADLPDDAPVPCVLATNVVVERDDGGEILDCSPAGVDMTRAATGLPLLIQHNAQQLAIGVVEGIKADGRRVTGHARFGSSPEAQQIRRDVIDGIHKSVSVGYTHVGIGRQDPKGNTVHRWQPHEVSIVSIPADPLAGFFRSQKTPQNTIMQTTTESTNTAEQIAILCERHGVNHLTASLIRSGDLSAAKEAVLTAIAVRDAAAGGHHNTTTPAATNTRSTAHDEKELIVRSLVARMGGDPGGEVITRCDAVGLAVRAMELAGQRVGSGLTRSAIVERSFGAHTSGDFSGLLGQAAGRVLADFYGETPVALKQIARLANLPDFREKSVIRLGAAPSLEKVNEHGEYKYGSIAEASNGWKLSTFGKIIALTRTALVNDDLDGFGQMLRSFGTAGARLEATELTAALVGAPVVDGQTVFDAARNTQISDKLSAAGLGAAIRALRAQTDMGELVAHEPGVLLVPSALEFAARQLMASINPAKTGDTQPFNLDVLVEPRLDTNSATAWYLVASRQTALEFGYLSGAAGVQISQREGFEIDGIELKARLDFGCGWVAPVGWVRSTGTV